MKVITRLSLASIISSLFSTLCLVVSVSAQDSHFVDPDCPPGTPPGTTCLPGGIIEGANGNNPGNPAGQFVDPDCLSPCENHREHAHTSNPTHSGQSLGLDGQHDEGRSDVFQDIYR